MQEVIVATPLSYDHLTKPHNFRNGISVCGIDPILWKKALVKDVISEREKEDLANTKYWLCVAEQVGNQQREGNSLYERAHRAMYAVQIICPSGCNNTYLKFQRTNEGFDNIGSNHNSRMLNTVMGRLVSLQEQRFEQDFEKIYAGVERAFQERIVRLQNPIVLLEHGLQIGNRPLSTLFWVMGLDILFMAVTRKSFVERINGFLEPSTLIFPSTSLLRLQPEKRVHDVLEDLYELRSIVAHGREIPTTPYLEECDLLDEKGARINSEGEYQYDDLMQEAALFLLCKSLRKILVEGFVEEIINERRWKQRLKISAKLFATSTRPVNISTPTKT